MEGNIIKVGDNEIREYKYLSEGENLFADNPYRYFLLKLKSNQRYQVQNLATFAVHIYSLNGIAKINSDWTLAKT